MERSADRIITTHSGSLPRPLDLIGALQARDNGESYDANDLDLRVREAIAGVVEKQVELGIDVVNDGEHSKSSFGAYVGQRLGGFEATDEPFGLPATLRDRTEFNAVYEEMAAMYAARPSHVQVPRRQQGRVCTGPIEYVGQEALEVDIANLQAAVKGQPVTEVFMTAISPNNVALYYSNRYYKSEEEYSLAIADAMRLEFEGIVNAGFLLQIDDPRLAAEYGRRLDFDVSDARRFMEKEIEVINYALRNIPEDRVRFHTCYSTNVAPRVHDLELKHYIDLLPKINAIGYTFEASNPRHEHEWVLWKDAKWPEHKQLIPGVVSHCTTLVEHPELVAQRIERFASVVGRERVIPSNDCGFATAGAGDEVHPLVAWAKARSLVEGARIASDRLWGHA